MYIYVVRERIRESKRPRSSRSFFKRFFSATVAPRRIVNCLSVIPSLSPSKTRRFIAGVLISSIVPNLSGPGTVYQSISCSVCRPGLVRSIESNLGCRPSAACARSDKNLKNSSNTRLNYKLFIVGHYFFRFICTVAGGRVGGDADTERGNYQRDEKQTMCVANKE